MPPAGPAEGTKPEVAAGWGIGAESPALLCKGRPDVSLYFLQAVK